MTNRFSANQPMNMIRDRSIASSPPARTRPTAFLQTYCIPAASPPPIWAPSTPACSCSIRGIWIIRVRILGDLFRPDGLHPPFISESTYQSSCIQYLINIIHIGFVRLLLTMHISYFIHFLLSSAPLNFSPPDSRGRSRLLRPLPHTAHARRAVSKPHLRPHERHPAQGRHPPRARTVDGPRYAAVRKRVAGAKAQPAANGFGEAAPRGAACI